MSLKDWLNSGWLAEHKTSPEEIRNLLGVADRDLTDCRSVGLSADWRMNIAYNAALQAATAALAVCAVIGQVGIRIITESFSRSHIQ